MGSLNNESYEKLIFRRDGRVHISSKGNVTDGEWEYLPEAKGLLIDYGDQKKLYQLQFLDEAVLALKVDGVSEDSDYFLLANQNVIPDLDINKYLWYKYIRDNSEEPDQLDDKTRLQYEGKEKVEYPDGITVWQSGEIPSRGDEVEGLDNGSFTINKEGSSIQYKISVLDGNVTVVTEYKR